MIGGELTRQAGLVPRLRTRECDACGKDFQQVRLMQAVCGPVCALRLVRAKQKAEKQAALQERQADRAAREKLKTRSDWMREAQAVVNRYCRLRDRGLGCISCGARPEQKFGGTMDAGHFRSVGSAPHLRFLTTQIRAQCVSCNQHKGGCQLEFRKGLIAIVGLSRVEEIEAMQGPAKFTVDYLKRLKKVFSKKARRLEKRHEQETEALQ